MSNYGHSKWIIVVGCLILGIVACRGDENGAADDQSPTLGTRLFTVPLAYLEGDSNYGPTDATGNAAIDTSTGSVQIAVLSLHTLDDDRYEGWLAGGGEEPVSTGRFNTDEAGVGSSAIKLGDLSQTRNTKVILTVEPEPDPSPAPDPRHSIGGLIPEP